MSLETVLAELAKLTREEKAQILKMIQDEIGQSAQSSCEVWSPQITPEGARQLLNLLQEDKQANNRNCQFS